MTEDSLRRSLTQAGAALAAGRHEVALRLYEAALAVDPEHELARFGEAACLHALGHLAEAAQGFGALADRHPENANYRYNQGYSLLLDARYGDAARILRECAGRVNDPHVRANLALALQHAPVRGLDEARALLDGAAAELPGDAMIQSNLAQLLLMTGDLAAGFRQYERRSVRGAPELPERSVAWSDQPLSAKTLFVWPEQGFGESLHFCRYLILLARRAAAERGAVVCKPPRALHRLFAHSFASLAPAVSIIGPDAQPQRAELHCSLVSLPFLLRANVTGIPNDVPYLYAEPALVGRWRERLLTIRDFKVGLVWSGATHEGIDPVLRLAYRRRHLALAQLVPLFDIPGVTFVSLQKGQPAEEAAAMAGRPSFVDVAAELDDFADTAAAIANLDLVITVDTAVCHLAGAMGRDVWLLNRRDADWRWGLDRTDSAWYPTLAQYRQSVQGEWGDVVERVAADLRRLRAEPA